MAVLVANNAAHNSARITDLNCLFVLGTYSIGACGLNAANDLAMNIYDLFVHPCTSP